MAWMHRRSWQVRRTQCMGSFQDWSSKHTRMTVFDLHCLFERNSFWCLFDHRWLKMTVKNAFTGVSKCYVGFVPG
jgi:hypothetical protein